MASVGCPGVVLLGPVWIAAVVLGAAGIGKLARPRAAQPSLRSLGLPSGIAAVRALGGAELAVALAVLAAGGRLAPALLAAFYAALTVASAVLRAQAGRGSAGAGGCGCFGRSSAPVGWGHVACNAGAALVAAAGAAVGLDALDAAWPQLPAAGFPHAVLVATGAAAVIALLTVLPETRLAAARRPAADPRIHLFGPTISRKPQPRPHRSAAHADDHADTQRQSPAFGGTGTGKEGP